MTPHRAPQLNAVLDWLGGTHARATGHPWLLTQTRTDGHSWRVVVWNASPDAVTHLRVRLPAGMPPPDTMTQLTATGGRVAATMTGDELCLEHPLHQWELVVLAVN